MDGMIPAWVKGRLTPVEKLAVHRQEPRHKAVSVFVLDGDRVLLQQHALGKYHMPGLWANTCCTHPLWGEADAACALRRLRAELGVTGLDVQATGTAEYRAEVGGGMVEHEVVALFRAKAGLGRRCCISNTSDTPPLSRLASGHANDFGSAECVDECNADLDFGGLAVGMSCGDAFIEGLEVEQVQRHRFERTCEGIFALNRLWA
jgi:isopentenyl-diphosphate delta-isomerase type 1